MTDTVYRVRRVPYTELVLSLLERTPSGMTSSALGQELNITSDGASRVAQKLHTQGRITRDMLHSDRHSQQIFVWRAKQHG